MNSGLPSNCRSITDSCFRKAVWSCYQENAVEFKGYSLFDPGAFPEKPLSGKITMKVTNPWIEQPDEKERDAKHNIQRP